MTPFGISEEIIEMLCKVFTEYEEIERVVIFGSRARGDFRNNSDIDMAVYAPTMTAMRFAQLHLDIDSLPIIFRMDIIHYDRCKEERLKNKIEEEAKDICIKK